MSQVLDLQNHSEPAPTLEIGKVMPPRRRPNAVSRSREYLTPAEVQTLLATASASGRYGQRDRTLILLMYRHGLRVGEAVALRWDQVDFKLGRLHVRRLKRGVESTHPLHGPEIRALRQLRRDWPGPYVFASERGGPMTTSNVRKLVTTLSMRANLPFAAHPHMLRHGCGYKLANEGHDTRSLQHYLGHRNITHTVRYTELSADRFKDFWED